MNTMNPCRCGGRGVVVRHTTPSLGNYDSYYCVCKRCGGRSAACDSVGAAIDEWNNKNKEY